MAQRLSPIRSYKMGFRKWAVLPPHKLEQYEKLKNFLKCRIKKIIKKEERMMENIKETSIQMSRVTRDRLKGCKKYRRETYDEIVNRLIDTYEEVKE